MSNQEDVNCIPPNIDLINLAALPSASSKNFNIDAFVAELSGIEALQGEETLYIYEPPFPTLEEITQAEKDIISSTTSDNRFTGEDVHNFIFSYYRPLDNSDTYGAAATTVTLTGCTFDGDIYTYNVPSTSTATSFIVDDLNQEVLLPVYDSYNRKVIFPITDLNGKYLLVESLTGLDAEQKIIYFPLKDVKNKNLKYPFKGVDGSISTHLPSRNNKTIEDVEEAYESLDLAYEKAKDADAFEFVNYILNLETDSKLGFFYGPIQDTATLAYFFTVGVYELSSAEEDLIDITSNNLKYFLRYHPDRAEYVYKLYQSFDGEGPWTLIQPTTSTDIAEIIKNQKEQFASYSSLTVPYWSSSENTRVTYENNSINTSPVHTSVLELYTQNSQNTNKTNVLQNQVSSLEMQLSSLSSQFVNLLNFVNILSTNVAYNSAVIDVLADPLNWGNIWYDKPTGYSRPIDPKSRPGPPF